MGTLERNGLVFDVATAGPPDGEPVVLLHGFPQTARSWDLLTPLLTERGLRTVAPDQRGYSPGARPPGRAAYRVSEAAADAVALIQDTLRGSGRSGVHLVGHDWGAAVAWHVAARHPSLVRTLTALSVPPPGAMARAMRTPKQLASSWYVFAIQVPGLADRILAAPPGRPFSDALVRMLVASGQTRERAERDATALGDRAAMTAALGWYRALPLSRDAAGGPRVRVPVLYVWSDGDTALTREAAELTPRFVDGPFRYVELRGVSHWIPEEAPGEVAELLLEHVAAHPA